MNIIIYFLAFLIATSNHAFIRIKNQTKQPVSISVILQSCPSKKKFLKTGETKTVYSGLIGKTDLCNVSGIKVYSVDEKKKRIKKIAEWHWKPYDITYDGQAIIHDYDGLYKIDFNKWPAK